MYDDRHDSSILLSAEEERSLADEEDPDAVIRRMFRCIVRPFVEEVRRRGRGCFRQHRDVYWLFLSLAEEGRLSEEDLA